MVFEIHVERRADRELEALRVSDHRRIVDAIESQLTHEPTVSTRNRKRLDGLRPAFEHVPPVWELRVGDFRVFYDVDVESRVVHVRSVRRKRADQLTEEIT